MADVELRVNRLRFKEWKRVSVQRAITAMADSFSLEYIDLNQRIDYPIKKGDKCEVFIGSNRIITGYVDVAEWSYSKDNEGNTTHNFVVEGRSKTGDLIDSSVLEPKTWKNKTFKSIATEVCSPFDIPVRFTSNIDSLVTAKIPRHSVEVGESASDCLGRLGKKLGVLMRTDTDGFLLIGRPPKVFEKSGIILGPGGARIKSGKRRDDDRDRHHLYVAYGQRQGSATITADAARDGKQSATDPRVTRYRPLVFVQDGDSADGTLTRAAEWVRNIRAGQGQRVSFTVQGWESQRGVVWDIGKTTIVTDPLLRLKQVPLIIESTSFTFDRRNGSLTGLDLVLPQSFESLSPPTEPRITDGVIAW